MDKTTQPNPLFPPIDPFDRRMVDVGEGHEIYVEQCGAQQGIPVIVLHGGPGGGCSPAMRRFFDPARFRVVLFDQRGCGRSRPHAELDGNTTWHLVRDIERIRTELGIDRWHVFGGSWGATLSLIYAQSHPEAVRSLILRGVFTMTQAELDWFYGGGAGQFWPEHWERFTAMVPEDERGDLIAAYHRRLFSGDPEEELRYAQVWTAWENALAAHAGGSFTLSPGAYARAFARIEAQYFHHRGWLDGETDIAARMDRIVHIPGVIVQGRYDMICPPSTAYHLASAWPAARLEMVSAAGHAMSEPGIARALVRVMDQIGRAGAERSGL